MVVARFELVIAIAPGTVPVRVSLAHAITTLGSSAQADVRLPMMPAEWLVVRSNPGGLELAHPATGGRHRLASGEHVDLDGARLTCEAVRIARSLPVDRLATALATADSPAAAVRAMLELSIAAAGASHGAMITTDGGAYRVALALDDRGEVIEDAAGLLSDTIVRDVLGTGERVSVADLAEHARYRGVPSVVSLRLRAVLCLPMRVEGRPLGALFLGKREVREPFDETLVADLRVMLAMAVPFLAQLRRANAAAPVAATDELLGESPAMHRVRELVRRVGPSDLSVLVLGGSGTGKELVARAVHAASARSGRPMIALNCASVPESLLGAELFGYQKGAFTGADTDRPGMIEAAAGSSLFLDEVGDMPLPMQAALLRVLEQREVKRLGEHTPRPVDFRLIAATNRDLDADAARGGFRGDLLFRLREVTVELPALRDRHDDLGLLAHVFLRQVEAQLSLATHRIGPEALARLRAHAWPGNVRELRATMRRAAVLADGEVIRAADLQIEGAEAGSSATPAPMLSVDDDRPLAEARDAFVEQYVRAAVERHGGNREAAARALGIGVRTLYRYLSS
jgi:DNA-binding NtrC family response regulator